jgi:hypothetical protein
MRPVPVQPPLRLVHLPPLPRRGENVALGLHEQRGPLACKAFKPLLRGALSAPRRDGLVPSSDRGIRRGGLLLGRVNYRHPGSLRISLH